MTTFVPAAATEWRTWRDHNFVTLCAYPHEANVVLSHTRVNRCVHGEAMIANGRTYAFIMSATDLLQARLYALHNPCDRARVLLALLALEYDA